MVWMTSGVARVQKRLQQAKRLMDEPAAVKAEEIMAEDAVQREKVDIRNPEAAGAGSIDYDRIAESASQRPVVVYIDKKAAAMLMTREMDTAIGNRNIQQLVSMGG